MVILKQYLKPNVVDFVIAKIEKKVLSSYFFTVNYKTTQNEFLNLIFLRFINLDVITKFKG